MALYEEDCVRNLRGALCRDAADYGDGELVYGYHTYAVIVYPNARDEVTTRSIAEINADENYHETILALKEANGWR